MYVKYMNINKLQTCREHFGKKKPFYKLDTSTSLRQLCDVWWRLAVTSLSSATLTIQFVATQITTKIFRHTVTGVLVQQYSSEENVLIYFWFMNNIFTMHIFQLDKVAYGDGNWHSNLKLPWEGLEVTLLKAPHEKIRAATSVSSWERPLE